MPGVRGDGSQRVGGWPVTRPWFSGVRHIPAELPLNMWQRKSIAADARHAWLRHRWNGSILFGWFLLQMVFAVFALGTLDWLREQQGWPDLSLVLVYAGGFGSMLAFWFWRERTLPRFVYAQLRSRGNDVCPGCGYLRRGLAGADACPECGAAT